MPEQRASNFLRLIETIDQAADASRSLNELLSAILEQLCHFFAASIGHMVLGRTALPVLSRNSDGSASHYWFSTTGGVPQRLIGFYQTPDESRAADFIQLVLQRREAAWISDLRQDETLPPSRSPWTAMVLESQLTSVIGFPAMVVDRVFATVELYRPTSFELTPDITSSLRHLSRFIGRVLEHRKLKDNLELSAAAQDIILTNAQDLAWLKDRQGRYVAVNEAFARMVQRPARQIIGKKDSEIWPPELARTYRKDDQDVIKLAQAKHLEEQGLDQGTGRLVKFETIKTPIKDPSGNVIGTVGISRDITKRKETEERLLQATQRLNLHIENSPLIIVEWDAEYRITRWNAEATRALGWSAEEAIGKRIQELPLVFEEDWPKVREVMERMKREDRPSRYVNINRNRKRDGSVLTCEWYNSALVGSQGEFLSIFSQGLDITERVRIENEREELLKLERKAHAEAVKANEAKDFFLATLSHELRTPLTTILSWAELLRSGKIGFPKYPKAAEMIEGAAKAQARLINDLLDVSRLASGKLALQVAEVDPILPFEQAMNAIAGEASTKSIKLEVQRRGEQVRIAGDPMRLQQIFWNLLSNAVKFSLPGGRVEVRLEGEREQFRLSVRDYGRGIPPDYLPHLFRRFSQADTTSTRRYGGLGLGLAIVRNLVDMHFGSVTAESEGEGKGALFSVCLPAVGVSPLAGQIGGTAVQPSRRADERVIQHARTALSQCRVLIVDDERAACEAFSEIISAELGIRSEVAFSAKEALEKIRSNPPDFLLSDIAMPEQDGYSLIRKVRESEREEIRRIPAVAITAYAGPEDVSKAISSGFNLHLAKPVDVLAMSAALLSLSEKVGKGEARRAA